MNQFLIRSDCHVIRSDEHPASFLDSPAQTSAHTRTRPAPDRTDPTWVVDRDLQTLRTAELPLRRRTRTRAEAIFVHEPARRTAAKGLRAKHGSPTGLSVHRQLSQIARGARRDLCHQHRTSPTPRGSRIDHHGSGTCRLRSCQGWRRPRRHDRIVPCSRCPAVRPGGAR